MHRDSGAVSPIEGIVMDYTVFSLSPTLVLLSYTDQANKDCSKIPKLWWELVL